MYKVTYYITQNDGGMTEQTVDCVAETEDAAIEKVKFLIIAEKDLSGYMYNIDDAGTIYIERHDGTPVETISGFDAKYTGKDGDEWWI